MHRLNIIVFVHLLINLHGAFGQAAAGNVSQFEDEAQSQMLNPDQVNNMIDTFKFNDIMYYFVNFDFNWEDASLYCRNSFGAELAHIDTEEKANFIAEALAETNHYMDSVWVGAKLIREDWVWISSGQQGQNVNKELLDQHYMKRENESEYGLSRTCLAFQRLDHDLPQYLSLPCNLPRIPLCEKANVSEGSGNQGSTHPGWIRLGERDYKIFQDRVPHDNASINCMRFMHTARLAEIVSFDDAQKLGRYLLIGRPSLEYAWIGAKWIDEAYAFPHENLILESKPNEETHYPPWRPYKQLRPGGCVLLDRHLSDTTYFVEASCFRRRPYICYKKVVHGGDGDVQFPDLNLWLIFNPKPFHDAQKDCEGKGGTLVEPKTEDKMKDVLFVMGENFTTIQHVWIGGQYKQKDEGEYSWTWNDETAIGDYPELIKNQTYTHDVESMNNCLNLDRVNHRTSLVYGTDCTFAQSYICEMPPGSMTKKKEVTQGPPAPAAPAAPAEPAAPPSDT